MLLRDASPSKISVLNASTSSAATFCPASSATPDRTRLSNVIAHDPEQVADLCRVLASYRDVIDIENRPLEQTSVVTHKLDTGDASPIRRRPYRMSHMERHVIQTKVDKTLAKSVIESLHIADCLGKNEGWQLAILCKLPSTEQDYEKGYLPSPVD